MNATHPSNTNADLPESASTSISAPLRKVMSWELNNFVQNYQTYTSPAAALVAARLADMYNPEKGHAWETQRQIAEAVGYEITAIKKALKEIEATGFWIFVHGSRGTATRYYPLPRELVRARMFIEYRMAGKLSQLPFKPVPRFASAKRQGNVGGFAKRAQEAKNAREILEAAEASMESEAVVASVSKPEPQSEPKYEMTAYSPEDMDDIPFGDEPDFDEPMETDDPFLKRTIVDPTEHFIDPFATTAPLTTPTKPVVRMDDDCPF